MSKNSRHKAIATRMSLYLTRTNVDTRFSYVLQGKVGMKHQLTGNAGLYHVARELSRRGWHVMPTVRNARGADLYAASNDEQRVIPIQSKALSKRNPVPLGTSLDTLRSPWWIVTINANTSSPTCYILTMEEVKASAHRGVNAAGQVSYWLQPKAYALAVFEEAWSRLGDPIPLATPD